MRGGKLAWGGQTPGTPRGTPGLSPPPGLHQGEGLSSVEPLPLVTRCYVRGEGLCSVEPLPLRALTQRRIKSFDLHLRKPGGWVANATHTGGDTYIIRGWGRDWREVGRKNRGKTQNPAVPVCSATPRLASDRPVWPVSLRTRAILFGPL